MVIVYNVFCIVSTVNLIAMEKKNEFFFSHKVNELWKKGNKKKVLEIANKILVKEPQNIIGLLIKFEYEITFLKFKKATSTANKILKNIIEKKYEKKRIKKRISLIKLEMENFIIIISHYPESERKADLRKANTKGKDLMFLSWIMAAEKDGLLPDNF